MLREKTIKPHEMQLYAAQAPSARDGHAIKRIVEYGYLRILEGQTLRDA